MEYRNDVNSEYKECIKIKNIIKILNAIYIVSSIILILNNKFNKIIIDKSSNIIISIINVILILLEIMFQLLINNANNDRIKTSIDNAYHTKLTDKKTNKFYNNDMETNKLKHLGLNSFESVFFSKFIIQKMIIRDIFLFVIQITLCIIFLFVLNVSIATKLINIIFTADIIITLSRECYYLFEAKNLYEKFRHLFIENNYSIKNEAEIIDIIIEYECLKSSTKILLNTKIFEKNKKELSDKWDEIKSEIQ